MATPPGVFVQLEANSQQAGFMGYQCLPSEGVCIPVQALTTYDQNYPLYNTRAECQQICSGTGYGGGGGMRSYGSYTDGGGDLDVDPGPKKAPK